MPRLSSVLFTLFALPAVADAPKVITDIAPIHSLTARVMDGVGTPDLLLTPGASPHDFALRPSDAARLSHADLVVWVGEGLTPWLEAPLHNLTNGLRVELLHSDDWPERQFSDDHDDHDDHEGHDHKEGHDHDHDHSGTDPHAWADPVVASVWVGHIADALSEIDPENAATYASNAQAAQAELASLTRDITKQLSGLTGQFIVSHDAYGYFTDRFNLPPAIAISASDAQRPGAAHMAELRGQVQSGAITCVLTDPQVSDDWADLLREGTDIRTARVDLIGGDLPQGADLYPHLLRNLANQFADCLGE